MELQRIGIKIYAEDSTAVEMEEFIPVFHRWIRERLIPEHLLIDVADYSHLWQGPGIVLVSHEANFSLDQASGHLGLYYQRKEPITGSFPDRLITGLRNALKACQLLEEDPALKGRISFRGEEILIAANDRLLAPAVEETFTQLEQSITTAAASCYQGEEIALTRAEGLKERPGFTIKTNEPVTVKNLLERLAP